MSHFSRPGIRLFGLLLLGLLVVGGEAAAQEASDTLRSRLDTLRVQVGRLQTGGIPAGRAPFSVQVLGSGASAGSGARAPGDLLGGAVGVSSASQFGNPLQPDIRFRGFQVGPVVGFPQSVSVFVDGVRVNEPDASQVNFDLIPFHALDRIELVRTPGGAFGRNALAGAINVVTRRGGEGPDPSGNVQVEGGSFSTIRTRVSVGGTVGPGVDYLVSGRYEDSDGWRDLSRTEVRKVFTKVGHRGERSDVWLSYTMADNYVEGPGSLPRSWLAGNLPEELSGTEDPRRLQFTGLEGDRFEPELHFLVLNGSRSIGDLTEVQTTLHLRSNAFTQYNDNVTEANVEGESDLLSFGATTQVVRSGTSGTTWTGGLEIVRNETDIFIFARPNPNFPNAGGMTEHVSSVEDNLGAFAQVRWEASSRAGLSASLRHDWVDLPVTDHLDPGNSGENVFSRTTGSLGGDLALTPTLRGFASYGRGFRAPVIMEISCSDPEDPCPLPFELGADPPLDPVVTDTWQAGLRYGAGGATAELIGYWSEVRDDLFAVVLPPATRGYFRNLDRTRRRGLELTGTLRPLPTLEVRGTLAATRATFQTHATLASAVLDDDDDDEAGQVETEANGDELGGAVRVEPGDHFAMVPALTAGFAATYAPEGWRLRLEGSYVGPQYLVGDEGNEEEFGKLDGYFVASGMAERALGELSIFVRGENLLDSEHYTFAMISPNTRGPSVEPQPFLSPGLPFHLSAGIRYGF